MTRPPPSSTLFPSPPLFRSRQRRESCAAARRILEQRARLLEVRRHVGPGRHLNCRYLHPSPHSAGVTIDRKSTRLNSSHLVISYAVFCLKKKNKIVDVDASL